MMNYVDVGPKCKREAGLYKGNTFNEYTTHSQNQHIKHDASHKTKGHLQLKKTNKQKLLTKLYLLYVLCSFWAIFQLSLRN